MAREMKYLLIVLLIGLAGLEFAHELWSADSPAAQVCTAPDAKLDVVTDTLRLHLDGHR